MRQNRTWNRLPHRSADAGFTTTARSGRAGSGTSDRGRGNRRARLVLSVIASAGHRPISTVLVPVDGSPFGEHALPLAVRVARAAGAALQVVHVFSAGDAAGDATRLLADDGWVRQQRQHRGEYLDGLARRLATTGPRPLTTALLDGGDVADAVCEAAAGASLVVMATRGRGAWARLWYGSIAADVARRSRVPVLLVRGGEDPPDFTGGRLPRHVLVPLDGTARAEAALGPAVALGSLSDATHELLHVVRAWRFAEDLARGYGGFMPLPGQSPEAEARRYLRRVADRLAGQHASARASVKLDDRTTAKAIARHAELTSADLIVMTAGGRGVLPRLFRDSVADQVLRRSAVPVLLCGPAEAEGCDTTRLPAPVRETGRGRCEGA